MELDPTICYQALLSRDLRFDGRFFGGVVTTGVYCRPVCPARTPKPENMRWFACAAAAEAAGFRPCRRCRPEAAPGTSAWLGNSAVVSRALRLISEGAMDETGLEEFSTRLGVSSRHLRRLFAEHLGASPHAIASARRIHFAARLIQETELPITEIAFTAGFKSVRQFNHAVLSAFGQAPTQIRNRRGLKTELRRLRDAHNGGGLLFRLPYRPPFFPQPETLAGADLRLMGIAQAPAVTIRALASAVACGRLKLDASQRLEDATSRLRAIPGVDEWTANYIAMRALGETDAFPVDDLGLRRALGARKDGNGPVSARELAEIAEEWRPWRAYAAMCLWASPTGDANGNEGE
jgi:methylphosphotriester-DNA--protein-cysteine methyltransferase